MEKILMIQRNMTILLKCKCELINKKRKNFGINWEKRTIEGNFFLRFSIGYHTLTVIAYRQ